MGKEEGVRWQINLKTLGRLSGSMRPTEVAVTRRLRHRAGVVLDIHPLTGMLYTRSLESGGWRQGVMAWKGLVGKLL